MHKLGRLPSPADKRAKTLKLQDYLGLESLDPPASVAVPNLQFPMDGNDTLGDCTAAGAAHCETLYSHAVGENMVPTQDQTIRFYSRTTGYIPGDPSTDRGGNMLQVLAKWRKEGFLPGVQSTELIAYAEIDPSSPRAYQLAVSLFGAAYIGVNLPQSAEDQFQAGQPWTVVPGSQIIGGHCVVVAGYTAAGPKILTWGGVVQASWAWLQTYCDEAYALLPMQWKDKTVDNFNNKQLLADLHRIDNGPSSWGGFDVLRRLFCR